jgi:tetratricopeptide (TPR) repeat protein
LEREALGQFPEALAAFDEARRLDPNLPMLMPAHLGALYEQLKMWPEAAAALEQATGLKQDDAESWAYLALAYQNQRQFDRAVTTYRKAIALNPSLTICRYNLGVLLLRAGDRSGAMEQLTALEGLDAKVASSLRELIEAQARAEHP